jgi:hypothetical protein
LTGCSSEYPFLATGKCKTCANRKAYEQKQKDEKKKADDKTTKDKKDREERERRDRRDAEKQSDKRQFIQDKKDAHKARFQKHKTRFKKHKTRFKKFESSKPLTKDEKREELAAKMNYKPSAFCLDFALFPHKFFLLDLFVCVHPLLLIRGFVFVCFYCPSSRAKIGLW